VSRKGPEPERIVRAADGTIVVEVEAGGEARVGRRDEEVFVGSGFRPVLGDREVVMLEEFGSDAMFDEVEFVDEQDVGPCALNDLSLIRIELQDPKADSFGEIARQFCA
jgi:hypothetical protein